MTDPSLIFPQQVDTKISAAATNTMGFLYDEEDDGSFDGGYSSMDESDDESLSLHSFKEDMFLDTPSSCYDVESATKSSLSSQPRLQQQQQQQFPNAADNSSSSSSSFSAPLDKLLQALDDASIATMDLCFPISDENDFRTLLDGLRSNNTVTECVVTDECFQSLTDCQKRELVFTIGEMPSLKCLILDSMFPEFLYTLNCCRCWKRDQYYQQYQRYYDFENHTLEVLQLRNIPADIYEGVLGNSVLSAVSLFGSLQRLDMTFASEFDGEQAVLTRVALAALQNSKSLRDVKLGFEDDFGDYMFMMEADTTRNDTIMRVLKLRCAYDNLSDQCYQDLSKMLQMNSRTLQGLVLDTPVDNALVLARTLGQNTNLKALCLGTFDCQEKASKEGLLGLVSQVLNPQRAPTQLEYLSLVCQEMDDQGVEQLSKAFSRSDLRELMLFLDNEIDGVVSSQGISALAKVFQVNETIEEFNLICHSLDDEGLLAFANALKVNDGTLRKLKLQCKSSRGLQVTSTGYKAMIDMLQTNTTLELFELSCCPGGSEEELEDNNAGAAANDDGADDFIDCETEAEAAHELYQPQIDYYLNLNKSGVRDCQLNIDATPDEFKTLLVSQRNDLNTLYYMLSTNPSFVAFAT